MTCIGILTCTFLMTQSPIQVSADVQAGRAFGELVIKQFIYLETHDVIQAKAGFEKLMGYGSYNTQFSNGFFQGLQEQIKAYDVKDIVSYASVDQEGYARFLVMYYYLLIYCDQAITAQGIAGINLDRIYEASYSLAAKRAYGEVSPDIIQQLQNSVHEFERVMQEKYL